MSVPKPHDPRAVSAIEPEQVAAQVNEVLSRSTDSLHEEAQSLEAAHRILNEALS